MLSPAVKHESSKTWISPWFTTGSFHRWCSPPPHFVYCSSMTDCVYLLQVCDLALPAALSWTTAAVQPSPGRLWGRAAAPPRQDKALELPICSTGPWLQLPLAQSQKLQCMWVLLLKDFLTFSPSQKWVCYHQVPTVFNERSRLFQCYFKKSATENILSRKFSSAARSSGSPQHPYAPDSRI